ncbi:hypothetical protein ACFQ1T_04970 [Methylophilus glucosoxydans]|jgi:hypothetical protein|uniref:Uncharacterized protein n=1 Tax=Methylophilus glucosoxydans TaxID=752553 RepID=A0ABW3GFR1_9PROT
MTQMIWQQYVYRRGNEVPELWDSLFKKRKPKLLYIAGQGFDVRVIKVMEKFLSTLDEVGIEVENAKLLLIEVNGYELSDELKKQTEENGKQLEALFSSIGSISRLPIGAPESSDDDEENDATATQILTAGVRSVIAQIDQYTDIILDVSSLPRVVYLSLLVGILGKLIPDKNKPDALYANGINFQVLVGEDPNLDGQIKSEDPSNEFINIPGFSSALNLESARDWPFVWFPVLGENRSGQLDKIISEKVQGNAEVCPVLPHPSKNPRRADSLILEYRETLFERMGVATTNVMYTHEAHPFETYRQMFKAMERYRISFQLLGGCRLVVTPLSSKLMTLGVGLACFNMKPQGQDENHVLAIPYSEPHRYSVTGAELKASKPEIFSLLLTGSAYEA